MTPSCRHVTTTIAASGRTVTFVALLATASASLAARPEMHEDPSERESPVAHDLANSGKAEHVRRRETVGNGSAKSVIRAAVALRDHAACRWCGGEGSSIGRERVKVPGRGSFVKPLFQDIVRDCSACEGSGYAKNDNVWILATKLAVELSTLDPDDSKTPRAIELVAEAGSQLLDIRPDLLGPILNGRAQSRLTSAVVAAGDPIVGLGVVLDDHGTALDAGERVWVVRLTGSGTIVVLRDPVVAFGEIGKQVLVCGVYAGRAVDADGAVVGAVLERGFALAHSNGGVAGQPRTTLVGSQGSRASPRASTTGASGRSSLSAVDHHRQMKQALDQQNLANAQRLALQHQRMLAPPTLPPRPTIPPTTVPNPPAPRPSIPTPVSPPLPPMRR